MIFESSFPLEDETFYESSSFLKLETLKLASGMRPMGNCFGN